MPLNLIKIRACVTLLETLFCWRTNLFFFQTKEHRLRVSENKMMRKIFAVRDRK